MQCSCGGALERGFLPDFSGPATWATVWLRGEPNTRKPMLEVLRTGAGVRANADDVRVVEAHRCTTCGRLELYARVAPDPSSTPARTS